MSSVALSESAGLRVLLYGGKWPTNLGNAFIDLGAMAILRRALPGAQIFSASQAPRWLFAHCRAPKRWDRWRGGLARWASRAGIGGLRPAASRQFTENALDLAALAECDLVVVPGMVMCEEFIAIHGPGLIAASRRGAGVLLLGTGADLYSEPERNAYLRFLEEVRPIGFISRDRPSLDRFASAAPIAREGIDCAFFLPEAYVPPPLRLPPYVAVAFDHIAAEPPVDSNGRGVVRLHHACWGPSRRTWVEDPNSLISDMPHDYLAVYAQAEEVHSNRVHACVAALAYGRRARLYSSTPRGAVFDEVGSGLIRQRLVEADPGVLDRKKEGMVLAVREIVAGALRAGGLNPAFKGTHPQHLAEGK